MTATGAFPRKELHEIVRTWRIWVVPGMMVFFAIASPIMALLLPVIVGSLVGDGITIEIPEPTLVDSYRQFVKNLTQILLVALIVTGAGSIPGERKQGSAVLVLSKPLSRAGFVIAKLISQLGLLVASAAVGAVLCWIVTALLFDGAPLGPVAQATGPWLSYAAVLVAAVTLTSAALNSQAGAVGIGLGVYFSLLSVGAWPWAANHTFAGLAAAADTVLTGVAVSTSWPLVTALATVLVLSGAAALSFGRKEL